MKKAFYFIGLFLLIYSCTIHKEPIFVKIDNIEVMSYAADTIKLKAMAFFENPNDVGGNISTNNLKILINDSEVAQLFSDDFNVPAKKEFSIPLLAKIPTKNLLNSDKNGLLGGLINSLLSKKVTVRIQGDLVYSFLGFQKDFLVDKTQDINIKF
tara:strand:+ start:47 stop:511 length:465 start_codon:yes stop_codon:yes gene_type:complete